MKYFTRSLSLSFAAGCFGALLYCLAIWSSVCSELTSHFKINIHPHFTVDWLYTRIVWGGLGGFLFALPYMRNSYFFRGLAYSFIPSFIQLFILLPFVEHKGFLGMKLGDFAPIFIICTNALWGLSAAICLRFTEK